MESAKGIVKLETNSFRYEEKTACVRTFLNMLRLYIQSARVIFMQKCVDPHSFGRVSW